MVFGGINSSLVGGSCDIEHFPFSSFDLAIAPCPENHGEKKKCRNDMITRIKGKSTHHCLGEACREEARV